MKKTVAFLLSIVMVLALLTGCLSGVFAPKKIITLYSFTDEVPKMIQIYKKSHPEFPYELKTTVISTTNGLYEPALDQALASGGSKAPDIYCTESSFTTKYTQGGMSRFACPYVDLGIDIAAKIAAAEIAGYTADLGTRTSDGAIVGLGYQATGGALIYRRSIAKAVWGTDDPDVVKTKVGPGWDQFFLAAAELKARGYGICSGSGDMWHAVENSSDKGWIVNGKLYIDAKREAFLDQSKQLKDNGYSNDTLDWTDAWFADMRGAGPKPIFGFFGPAWMITYIMAPNSGGTSGDWAVCESPIGFFWGGTWIMVNKAVKDDPEKAAAIAELIEWVTLDCSTTGLQYSWANGTLLGLNDTKDTVVSAAVMKISNGTEAFLGGQNMFDVFIEAGKSAKGKNLTQYDQTINRLWLSQVRQYTAGTVTRDQAIAAFKLSVRDTLGFGY